MIYESLYKRVLLDPVINDGADYLQVVSGYSSPSMVVRHFDSIKGANSNIKIDLIYGMAKCDGISPSAHKVFSNLQTDRYKGFFRCNYMKMKTVHAKVYIWSKKGSPFMAYCGSANYTQNGFGINRQEQIEVMTDVNHSEASIFFKNMWGKSISCIDSSSYLEKILSAYKVTDRNNLLPQIEISLLRKNGDIHSRSGLNWGQREGRKKSQAYIPLPSKIRTERFFPENDYFTVYTEDDINLAFTAKLAQQGKKAIHSTNDNSIIGQYFRKKMGLDENAFITKEALLNYGRTDVTFVKVNNETFIMDFSTHN